MRHYIFAFTIFITFSNLAYCQNTPNLSKTHSPKSLIGTWVLDSAFVDGNYKLKARVQNEKNSFLDIGTVNDPWLINFTDYGIKTMYKKSSGASGVIEIRKFELENGIINEYDIESGKQTGVLFLEKGILIDRVNNNVYYYFSKLH